MDKAGQSIRILCDALCSIKFEGKNDQGIIENVSLTGALIKMDAAIPAALCPGVTCDLMIYSEMPGSCTEYKCLVVRIDSNLIGLKFLEIIIAGSAA